MPRRRREGAADAVIELTSKLPWWAGVALALVSYLLLHAIAAQPVAPPKAPGQISAVMTQSLWRSLANVGQYLLPFLFLVGAGLSAWQRRQRRQLVAQVVAAEPSSALTDMSWQQFEQLVAEGFRLQGYRVLETGGGGPDGGVDLVLSRPGRDGSEKLLVQCKQWRAFKVGVGVVRELYGVMAATGAAAGCVVTSGRFTREAVAFAEGRNVELMDGPKLLALIRRAQLGKTPDAPPEKQRPPSRPGGAANVRKAGPAAASTTPVAAAVDPTVPTCPQCTQPMVARRARQGAHAGKAFWGCTGFPACRGTRPLEQEPVDA